MQRVVSLIPYATEIVCLLGLEAQLAGRSHECDYPPSVQRLPICTAPAVDVSGSSAEIDRQVKSALRDALAATGCPSWSIWLAVTIASARQARTRRG